MIPTAADEDEKRRLRLRRYRQDMAKGTFLIALGIFMFIGLMILSNLKRDEFQPILVDGQT